MPDEIPDFLKTTLVVHLHVADIFIEHDHDYKKNDIYMFSFQLTEFTERKNTVQY